MEESFTYVKERRQFGRQCLFTAKHEVIVNESTLPEFGKDYILRNPVTCATQLSTQMAFSEMNSINVIRNCHGANHVEGGWPKDVNYLDEEQTVRHKKKTDRDDQYIIQLNNIVDNMIHTIQQNNAVDLYEYYFETMEPVPLREDYTAKILRCFHAPGSETAPANCVSFSPEGGEQMAVAYADLKYQASQKDPASFLWDVENSQFPFLKLESHSPITCLEYNHKDVTVLAGGLINGKVCTYDARTGGPPRLIIEQEEAHRDCIRSLLWVQSKTGSEFYSGSADGQLYWWDMRNLTQPVESLLCDPIRSEFQNRARSYGVSVLEFEPTIPTRYMVGTDQGYVFYGNKKGVTFNERIVARIKSHEGQIFSLERNPIFSKNFLTVGDYMLKFWSEDVKEQPIIWTQNQKALLRTATWSHTRCSLVFIGNSIGEVQFLDLLTDQKRPIFQIKVSDAPIKHIRCHESGQFISVSDGNGDVFIVFLSENLWTSDKNDRAYMAAMFEREMRREKVLEGKLRELKLKEKEEKEEREEKEREEKEIEEKAKEEKEEKEQEDAEEIEDYEEEKPENEGGEEDEDPVVIAEKNFYEFIEQEKKKLEALGQYLRKDHHETVDENYEIGQSEGQEEDWNETEKNDYEGEKE